MYIHTNLLWNWYIPADTHTHTLSLSAAIFHSFTQNPSPRITHAHTHTSHITHHIHVPNSPHQKLQFLTSHSPPQNSLSPKASSSPIQSSKQSCVPLSISAKAATPLRSTDKSIKTNTACSERCLLCVVAWTRSSIALRWRCWGGGGGMSEGVKE